MALLACPDCGKQFSDQAAACPNCGRPNPNRPVLPPRTPAPKKKAGPGCLGLGLIVVIVFGIIAAAVGNSSRSSTASGAVASPAIPATPSKPGSQWSYAQNPDAMSGGTSRTATVSSENTVNFSFPYEGEQPGTLMLRRHPRFGSNVIFSIEKGQLLCRSYEDCTVLVRFDDGQPSEFSARGPADNSTETLFISNYERFVSRLQTAKTVRISPPVYRQGSVVFTFNVAGFDSKRFRGK